MNRVIWYLDRQDVTFWYRYWSFSVQLFIQHRAQTQSRTPTDNKDGAAHLHVRCCCWVTMEPENAVVDHAVTIVRTRLTSRLLVAVLVGLLPGSVVAGTGRGADSSDGRPDRRTGVRVLIVLMSGSDRFGCTETSGQQCVAAPPPGPKA